MSENFIIFVVEKRNKDNNNKSKIKIMNQKKIYLVFKKKMVNAPDADIHFEGIVSIVGAYTSTDEANKAIDDNYKKTKKDFYDTQEAFAKGDVYWRDKNHKMEQVEPGKYTTVKWEIKEVEVEDTYDPCPFFQGPDKK